MRIADNATTSFGVFAGGAYDASWSDTVGGARATHIAKPYSI